jgi:hypothetical protein
MDRGRIVETGRHAQLLTRNGLYARLYRTQFAAEQDTVPLETGPGFSLRPFAEEEKVGAAAATAEGA